MSEQRSPYADGGLTVRAMTSADVDAVSVIERASFTDAWPPSAFLELLPRPYARLRVALDASGVLVGYCVLLRAADEGEIANIACAPAARQRGVGAALLDDALRAADAEGAQTVYLEVRTSNLAARTLYGGRGFEVVGRRRGYYQQPAEDALVMRRTRPEPPQASE